MGFRARHRDVAASNFHTSHDVSVTSNGQEPPDQGSLKYGTSIPLRSDEVRTAWQALRLIFFSKNWINRRVDTVSFPDSLSVNRRVSVDLTVPDQLPEWGGEKIIPIAMIHREGMINFDCRDEKGDAWPLLTWRKTRQIERLALLQWAEVRNLKPSDDDGDKIEDIIKKVVSDARPEPEMDDDLANKLTSIEFQDSGSDPSFSALAQMLTRNFVLFAVLPKEVKPGDRKILKFTYDRPLELTKRIEGPRNCIQRTLCALRCRIWPVRMRLLLSAANTAYARSYHFQLITPGDVAVTYAALFDDEPSPTNGQCTVFREISEAASTRCDLYPESGVPMGTRGRTLIEIAPVKRMWVAAASTISLMVGIGLAVIGSLWAANPKRITPSTDSVNVIVGLILALVAVIVPIVVSPEQDNFSRYMLARVRITSMLIGIALTAFIVTVFVGAWSPEFIIALGGAVLISSALQFLTLIRSVSPIRRRRYKQRDTKKAAKTRARDEILAGVVHQLVRPRSTPGNEVTRDSYEHANLRASREAIQSVLEVNSVAGVKADNWWV